MQGTYTLPHFSYAAYMRQCTVFKNKQVQRTPIFVAAMQHKVCKVQRTVIFICSLFMLEKGFGALHLCTS
jgi:hypothetical protein